MTEYKISSPSTLGSELTVTEQVLYDLDIQGSEVQPRVEPPIKIRKAMLYMLFEKKDVSLQIAAIIATLLSALTHSVSAILMGKVFDVLSKLVRGEYRDFDEYMSDITRTTMSLLALGACTMPVIWGTISFWMTIGERHGSRARCLMLQKYMNRSIDWYESNGQVIGDLTMLNRCVEELRAGNSEATAITLEDFVTIISLFGTSLYYSWSVTLVMIATTPLILILSYVFAKLVEKLTTLENTKTSKAAKIFDWSLSSAKLVRLFQTQMQEYQQFHNAVKECKQAFLKLALVSSLNIGSLRFVVLCMFVQGFWYGSDQVRKGNATAGQVLTCFSSCLMLGESFRSMLPQIITIQKANVAMKRIQDFIQMRTTRVIDYRAENINRIKICPDICRGDIKFKSVDFSYPTRLETKILKNVTLHFPCGELTFIVGRSGSGKSTLSNLLLNFYTPSKGRVEIDGFNVADINSDWLGNNITLVEQYSTLFNDSIQNNILMGNNNSTVMSENESEKVQEAIELALLQEVIRDLPHGLHTVVGSNGVQLSGGQQQRIAIARARLRDTPILILDEAVSALDIVLRDLIMQAIKKWRSGKTTIILTHEYSQIHRDDYVYLMESGEVAEFGYRRDIELQSDGIFRKLASLQKNSTGVEAREQLGNDDGFQAGILENSKLLNGCGSRMSTYLFSTFKSKGMVQNEKKTDSAPIKRQIWRRNKKELTDATLEKGDEHQEKNEGGDSDRPELTPIRQIIKRMFQTVNQKGILFLGIISSLLNGAVNPIFSYCFSKLLVGIVPEGKGSDVGQPSYLLKWSLIVIFLALFDGFSTFMKEFLLDYSSEIWIFALRRKVFSAVSRQSLSWFNENNNTASEINTLVLNDSRDLRNLVSQFLSIISTVIVLANVGLIWALIKGWKLSLVCISLIPLFVLVTGIYAGLLQSSENKYKNAVADLETQLYEIVKGIKTIKTLKLYNHFLIKFDKKMNILGQVSKRRAILTGFGVAVTNALTFVVQGVLLYYGMKLVGRKEYSTGQLMECFTLLLFSIISCAQLMNSIPEVSRGQRAGSYIFKLLEMLPSEAESKGNLIPTDNYDKDELFRFQNVNFAYPLSPRQEVLKDVSFKIAKNEHVAIIGESGSGKSTITLLITRLFVFEDHSVFFQGQDVNQININWLRDKVALVDQKPSFFEGTIYENLTYGLSNPAESKVIQCLKMVNIYDFVEALPSGINTIVDTSRISGGQAQRLSIARALLRNPMLLILDECTSALDAENSYKIAQLIQSKLKGITVLMITHSEEIMKISDRVLTLRSGSLVEEGTFDELYSCRGELYKIITAGLRG